MTAKTHAISKGTRWPIKLEGKPLPVLPQRPTNWPR